MASIHLKPGDIFASQFRVEKLLAEGGMGAVFVVEQISTGRKRALKLMQPQLLTDPKLVERFVQEARIGSRLDAEHVVDVIDSGADSTSGAPWLLMELLKGEPLSDRLRRGPLSTSETLELFRQLGHGLGQAHALQVVHRDLKPENLFLCETSTGGFRLKILDFGIAKVLEDARTRSTGALGTPLFMPPEQMVPGRAITPASDVWAMGLIAFQCLTGRSFWHAASAGGSAMMLMNEVVNLPLDPASVRATSLGLVPPPAEFDAWFARCVSRDQAARFADAARAVAGLAPALSSVRPSTTPPAPLEKTDFAAPLPLKPAPAKPVAFDPFPGRTRGTPTAQPVVRNTEIVAPASAPREAATAKTMGALPWFALPAGAVLLIVVVVIVAVGSTSSSQSTATPNVASSPPYRAPSFPPIRSSQASSSAAAPPTAPDFKKLLGTPSDGFMPVVFWKLAVGMSPAAVGRIIPGGEVVRTWEADGIKYAESTVARPQDGVDAFRFRFTQERLTSIVIDFGAATRGTAGRLDLINAIKMRLPDTKPTDEWGPRWGPERAPCCGHDWTLVASEDRWALWVTL